MVHRLGVTPDALGNKTRSIHDPRGNVLTLTNALGHTTTNTYDAFSRLLTSVDPENIVNSFQYDAAGNRTKVVDGKGQETDFTYDGLNRLLTQTFDNGDTITHTYNAVQKLTQTSPRGITTSFTYDERDRVLTSSAPAGDGAAALSRAMAYDAKGRVLTVTEAGRLEAAVSYTYDLAGRLLTETSQGLTHTYSYDLAGNRIRAAYGTGRTVESSYDAMNRPETIAEGGRLTTYGYDRAGRAVILVLGNGQVTENDHDLAGRLTHRTLYSSLENRTPTGILATFDWTYNALGNVMTQQESWPGALGGTGVKTTTMSYDQASRLTGEHIDVPTGSDTNTLYAYDEANNRASKTVTGGSGAGHWDYDYNSANQLTGWEKRDVAEGTVLRQATLTYDDAGNRASQTITGGAASTALAPAETATGTTTYHWDAQDRLVAVNTPDGGEHLYAYDYRTRRIATQETPVSGPAKNRAVVFSGGVSLAEYEGSTPVTVAPGLQPAVHYLRGPDMGGGVGGMLYSQRGSTLKYSLSNGRGDIVAQSNQSRAITWQASYEAYGRRTQETGINEDRQRANSKEEDPTGLLNEGFRYRDLETGVWLSRDPAGFVDGPNLYAYVQQNPWSCFDPKGLSKEWHHDLPKDHEERFKKYDIDVHDSKNGSFLDAEKHNQLHSKGKYNQHWSDFLDKMDNITDSAKARSEILNHMEDIRAGKVGDFAGYYKDAVRVGEGLNYNTHWHFKNGTLSSKQRGQVITAALDASKMGKGIAFDVGKQFGRKLPIVKYAMGGLAFSTGQSFAKEALGMSDSSARMVGFIDALNPAPLGVQDLYELGQDNLQLQAGRRQADINNIGRTGYPLYMFSSWNRFNTPDPPQEWTQNPQGHMPELIQHWGR